MMKRRWFLIGVLQNPAYWSAFFYFSAQKKRSIEALFL
jgi:hypothetical protein